MLVSISKLSKTYRIFVESHDIFPDITVSIARGLATPNQIVLWLFAIEYICIFSYLSINAAQFKNRTLAVGGFVTNLSAGQILIYCLLPNTHFNHWTNAIRLRG